MDDARTACLDMRLDGEYDGVALVARHDGIGERAATRGDRDRIVMKRLPVPRGLGLTHDYP
jgi:hypothetical protein